MAVTNYDTVNGQLIGEIAVGATTTGTTYLADELGSVVATASSGAIVNTYRYSPYGKLLTQSGTGFGPLFGWLGAWGYRVCGHNLCEEYVRARAYSTTSARWTTLDPLGIDGQQYVYGACSQVAFVDPARADDCESKKPYVRVTSKTN
jgi:RHS repeat-associated protein